MPDNTDRYELSDGDFVFIMTALEALKEDLEGMLTNETTRDRAQWNIEIVNSTMYKLNNREIEFTEDEGRVMYVAALEMRDLMNKILDNKASSEYDREMARSTLHSANAMMRILRKTFIENGIGVDDLC